MSEPIRILHVLQRMEAGGTQALLMNLYRNIDKEKVQFDFLVEYPNKQFYDDEITEMGGKIYYTNVRNDYNLIKYQKQLRKILKENNYKIIHVHAFTIGFITLRTAKECGVPVRIAHSHNNETVRDKKFIFKKIMQKIYPIYATDLFACSEEAGKYLFGNKKYTVLNNSIDTSKFIKDEKVRKEVRNELGVSDNFVIGNVGRLHPQKNQIFLIDIFKEVIKEKKNAKLLIVGQGPLESQIRQHIRELDLTNDVILMENRKDINRVYQAMDIFVLPSLFEGLGIVAIEAQTAGLPVICSNGVAKEACITKNSMRLNLNDGINIWIDNILNFNTDKNEDILKKIVGAGYDIQDNAKKMQLYYINKYKKM